MSARLAHEIKNPLARYRQWSSFEKKCRDGLYPEKVEMARPSNRKHSTRELTRKQSRFCPSAGMSGLPLNLRGRRRHPAYFQSASVRRKHFRAFDNTVPGLPFVTKCDQTDFAEFLKTLLMRAENPAVVRLEIAVDSETVILRVYNPAGYFSTRF